MLYLEQMLVWGKALVKDGMRRVQFEKREEKEQFNSHFGFSKGAVLFETTGGNVGSDNDRGSGSD